jgi:hypothetical protein
MVGETAMEQALFFISSAHLRRYSDDKRAISDTRERRNYGAKYYKNM